MGSHQRVVYNKSSEATLAQLVERLIRNQQVAGSIPAGGSTEESIAYGQTPTSKTQHVGNNFVNCCRATAPAQPRRVYRGPQTLTIVYAPDDRRGLSGGPP